MVFKSSLAEANQNWNALGSAFSAPFAIDVCTLLVKTRPASSQVIWCVATRRLPLLRSLVANRGGASVGSGPLTDVHGEASSSYSNV